MQYLVFFLALAILFLVSLFGYLYYLVGENEIPCEKYLPIGPHGENQLVMVFMSPVEKAQQALLLMYDFFLFFVAEFLGYLRELRGDETEKDELTKALEEDLARSRSSRAVKEESYLIERRRRKIAHETDTEHSLGKDED